MPVGLIKDGDIKFDRGLDSMSDLLSLPQGGYGWSTNMLNRGGVTKSRPGFQWRYTLPAGKLQGLSVFTPGIGFPVLVAFVSGVGYSSVYPYTSFQRIQGAQMSATAAQVYTAQCVQTVANNPDGSLRLISPTQLLMVQDGVNPPAYFDGRIMTALTGPGVTPQGTFIAWVGARLWVARGELVFASDIGNPTSFLEQTYNTLGGVQYFILPDQCTGLAPVPGAPNTYTQLLAFTSSTTTQFQANILNRTLWPGVQNFQAVLFPNVGCVAGKSIAAVSGMLWWFSQIGVQRLDSAQATALTSRIFRQDREMVRSGAYLSKDLSRVCAAVYENFALFSVPYASLQNKHTWVYDASVDDLASQNMVAYATTSWSREWSSVWTGVSPVEWASLNVTGTVRLFCASVDADGNNRVYEAFTNSTRDNGCDFPWSFETRAYTGGTPLPKQFRYLTYSLSELQGQVNLRVSWAGASRGRWKAISTPTFYAEEGVLDAKKILTMDSVLYALKKQSRIARTQDVNDLMADILSSAGIEGLVESVEPDKETIDTAFQFRFEGSGPCAIRGVYGFFDATPPPDSGEPTKYDRPESHFVRFDGGASREEPELDAAPESFTTSAHGVAEWHNYVAQADAVLTSYISKADANKRAAQIAQARAQTILEATALPYVGGTLNGESS